MTYGSSSAINQIKEAVANGNDTLGEIITWSVDGSVAITYTLIQDALRQAGMDGKFARELCPRYAFSRACKELEEGRIIRQVGETSTHLTFQFTKEAMNAAVGLLEYSFECKLELNKKNGVVRCSANQALADHAQRLIKDKTEQRTTSDVSNIVQRMFGKHADLFPVREKGGCYFVPKCYSEFTDKVEAFLGRLGGHINRFPILAGQQRGTQSVKTVVTQGLLAMVEDHRKAIQKMTTSTLDATFESRLQAIEHTGHKIEGYGYFLKDQSDMLFEAVEMAKRELMQAKAGLVEKALA